MAQCANCGSECPEPEVKPGMPRPCVFCTNTCKQLFWASATPIEDTLPGGPLDGIWEQSGLRLENAPAYQQPIDIDAYAWRIAARFYALSAVIFVAIVAIISAEVAAKTFFVSGWFVLALLVGAIGMIVTGSVAARDFKKRLQEGTKSVR